MLFYNRKAFEAAGLDPDAPPTTFDELRAAAQKVVDSGAARYGFALGLAPDFVEQWFAKANVAFTDHDNGRTDRASHVAYDAPIALEIYTFLAGLVNDGLAVNTGRQSAGPNHLLSVGSGESAMTIASSAVLGSVFDILEQGQFPGVGLDGAAVAPMPGPSGRRGPARWGVAVPRGQGQDPRGGRGRLRLRPLPQRARDPGPLARRNRLPPDPDIRRSSCPRSPRSGRPSPPTGWPTTSCWPRRRRSAVR